MGPSSCPIPSLGPPTQSGYCGVDGVTAGRLGSLRGTCLVWAGSQALVAPWGLGGSLSLSEVREARVAAYHFCPWGVPDTGTAGHAPRAILDGTAVWAESGAGGAVGLDPCPGQTWGRGEGPTLLFSV